MVSYVNTHAQLEAIRDIALANADRGPRVIIVGPKVREMLLVKFLLLLQISLTVGNKSPNRCGTDSSS